MYVYQNFRTAVLAALVVGVCVSGSAMADLIDHYELENNGLDSAGGDANGVVGGNVSFTAGQLGQSAVFGVSAEISNNRIDVPQANAFSPGAGDFTFAFWIMRDEADAANGDGVFDAMAGTGTGYQANFRGGADEHKMGIRLDDNTGAFSLVVAQNAMPDTTEFHHYALTVDRIGNSAVLYVDGVADPAVDISALTGSIVPDNDLQIGGLNNSVIMGLDGRLDDLRFYNHKLSATEVEALVPEPASLALLGLGSLALIRRR